MRQALHIFKKDVRQCRYQIALVLAATAIFTYANTAGWAPPPDYVPSFVVNARPLISADVDSSSGLFAFAGSSSDSSMLPSLVVFAWCCLIALVVHADAIPGDRQFWLTRPYDRRSLWGAKALFALAFVNLPLFIAQAAIIATHGFSLISHLPALLWEQVLLSAVIVTPAMAAAAVTKTMMQFVFLLLVVAFATSGFAMIILGPLLTLLPSRLSQWFFESVYAQGPTAGSLAWLTDFAGGAVLAIAAITILFLQFLQRQTFRSRLLVLAGGAVALAASGPWTPAVAVPFLFAKPLDGSLRAEITRPRPATLPRFGVSDTLDLPLRLAGLPAGTLLACDAATVRIDSPSGATWQSGVLRLGSRISQAPDGCRLQPIVDNTFFNDNRGQQVRIESTLYFTVFGNERTTSLPRESDPVTVPDVGVCRSVRAASSARAAAVMCRDAFRWPGRLVWVRDGTGRGDVFAEPISYSPFPSELRISPVESQWARAFTDVSGRVAITTQAPLAHVRTDADLSDVLLGDLEFGAR